MASILPKGEPPRTPEIPPGCTLSDADAAYLEARGVSRATAEAAGCYTATRPSQVPTAFSERQRRNVPALIVPHVSPSGAVGYQKRDHRPGKDRRGKPIKWASPKGARPVIAGHPWTADEARAARRPLWAVEGVTRMMALAELGGAALSYAGCYSWQKDGAALADWDSVELDGRLVYDVPDADARTNWQVQTMQAARVAYFESRGARVLTVAVPEVGGDEHAGLDDYIAAGGDMGALVRDARPFEPADVGGARLTKDERLRRLVGAKILQAAELPARKPRECNAAKVARCLAGTLAPDRGKVRPQGVEVVAGFAEIAELVRLGSLQTVSKALDLLDETGFLVIQRAPKGGRAASSYLLLDPTRAGCALGVNKEGRGVGGKESQKQGGEKETPLYQRDSYTSLHSTSIPPDPRTLPDAPALRNSKLVHTFEYKGSKRTVVDSQYFRRYGSKRELIIRHLLERGECVETAELWEKFGSKTSTLPKFFRTWIGKMVRDGVVRGDTGSVEMAPDWREALEAVRARTDEDEDNRRQSEKYARQRRDRRARFAGEARGEISRPEPVPELMGPERVAEIFAADAERDHAARVEAQRRKVGTTAATFIADALEGVSGFGWQELGDLWRERGGKREDLRCAVVDPSSPWTFRREDGGRLFYVERRAPESINTTGKKAGDVLQLRPDSLARIDTPSLTKPDTAEGAKPAPRAGPGGTGGRHAGDVKPGQPRPLPPKVGGVIVHGPECGCWMCEDEGPPVEAGEAGAKIGASA